MRDPLRPAVRVPDMIRLLIVGQSHLGAFLRVFEPALDNEAAVAGPESLEVDFVRVGKQRSVALTPGPDGPVCTILGGWRHDARTLALEVERLAQTVHAVALAWRGNEMNVRGLFASGPAFDLILPGDDSRVIDGAQLLPYSALASFARRTLDDDEGLRLVLEGLRSSGVERILLLSPPPPRSNETVLEKLSQESFLANRARSMGYEPAEVPLTPAPVRYKLWRVMVEAYRTYAEDHDITFLESPAAAHARDGLLASRFQADDVSHGNAAYARIYLGAIHATIRS